MVNINGWIIHSIKQDDKSGRSVVVTVNKEHFLTKEKTKFHETYFFDNEINFDMYYDLWELIPQVAAPVIYLFLVRYSKNLYVGIDFQEAMKKRI